MTPLSFDSAVSFTPLSFDLAVSVTPLSFDSAVSITPLSHGTKIYIKMDFYWLSGVNDTAQFWLSGVNDTSEAWLSGVIDTAESWLSGVIGDLKLVYLGKLTNFFETILGCESEAYGEMIYEKNRRSKISWDCPFNCAKATKITVSPFESKNVHYWKLAPCWHVRRGGAWPRARGCAGRMGCCVSGRSGQVSPADTPKKRPLSREFQVTYTNCQENCILFVVHNLTRKSDFVFSPEANSYKLNDIP